MQVSGPPSKLCPKVLKEALTCISVGFFASATGTPKTAGVDRVNHATYQTVLGTAPSLAIVLDPQA
ncbi:hypothetical protein FHR32_007113 [Streptosporangium album]|uniref:Uncharacterized protein n=1 Tax=Streptosporangium album TaxID=47479 RepID=A0A7W7S3T6_9ACTN|nr:hypothetical protein [Streptosporangium album]